MIGLFPSYKLEEIELGLNGCFHEVSENKTANVSSLILAGFYCSYGDISVKALQL